MNRREALKATALAAATAAASGLAVAENSVTADQAARTPGVKWDKAPCRFCGTGCTVQVGTKDGKVVSIAGDQAAEVNRGLLCVKGYHVGLILYGKDRLTTPLLRKDGKMVPITWEEAIDVMAKRGQRVVAVESGRIGSALTAVPWLSGGKPLKTGAAVTASNLTWAAPM